MAQTSKREQVSPGLRVVIRDEEWMVKKVEHNSLGGHTLFVVGLSPLVKDREMQFLRDLEEEVEILDPRRTRMIPDTSPFFIQSRLFLESLLREQIPTDDSLHIGHTAAMDVMPFQLQPAQMALGQTRQRILIADAVGLGKTLEAGILLSELIARGRGKRILVVTVKSMMTQFQKELWNRFTIPLVRLDSKKIQKIRSQIPSNHNPFFYYDRTIVSIDTLKRDLEYRTHLENAWWDIIVMDEAHNVAVRGTHKAQRSRLAQLLAERSDTLIMLSATPHDGRSESFASLMNMLDPTAIADPHHYSKEDIAGLFVRRFKKDIKQEALGAFPDRFTAIEETPASKEEERAYGVLATLSLKLDERIHGGSHLFRTILAKSLFSSPSACSLTIKHRISRLEKQGTEDAKHDIKQLDTLLEKVDLIQKEAFSRYQKLLSLLRDASYGWKIEDPADRVVIFTERIETMHFVAEHLKADLGISDRAVQTLHGGMNDTEQQRIVEEFGRTEAFVRLLVASDVASEGINLHFLCHRLIHFDIPWSLMTFQQRNGRIDRYGQSEKPDIRYLMTKAESNSRIAGDMRILKILVEKEKQAMENIGDPASIMGVYDVEQEEIITGTFMEKGQDPREFSTALEGSSHLQALMEGILAGGKKKTVLRRTDRKTVFSPISYLKEGVRYFLRDTLYSMQDLVSFEGVELTLNPELKRRLGALLPEEAMPRDGTLILSPDKKACMEDMRFSLQNSMDESAWPKVQYLWPLHPIFRWMNDKASLLFQRKEAPLLGLSGPLSENEVLILVSGLIPNRRSTPVVDTWFGLYYQNQQFCGEWTLEEVLQKTKLRTGVEPNVNALGKTQVVMIQSLLDDAVKQAEKILASHYNQYKNRMDPLINSELKKLSSLQQRHTQFIKGKHAENLLLQKEGLRTVEATFERFVDWVHDTLEIEETPYIRVLAAFTGVKE